VSIARPDRAFFFIATACALAYVSLPRDTAYYDRWYQLFPVAAVGATLVGVWLNSPRSRTDFDVCMPAAEGLRHLKWNLKACAIFSETAAH